jgi:hypothetical protein
VEKAGHPDLGLLLEGEGERIRHGEREHGHVDGVVVRVFVEILDQGQGHDGIAVPLEHAADVFHHSFRLGSRGDFAQADILQHRNHGMDRVVVDLPCEGVVVLLFLFRGFYPDVADSQGLDPLLDVGDREPLLFRLVEEADEAIDVVGGKPLFEHDRRDPDGGKPLHEKIQGGGQVEYGDPLEHQGVVRDG